MVLVENYDLESPTDIAKREKIANITLANRRPSIILFFVDWKSCQRISAGENISGGWTDSECRKFFWRCRLAWKGVILFPLVWPTGWPGTESSRR
jgi:hypothetical protein